MNVPDKLARLGRAIGAIEDGNVTTATLAELEAAVADVYGPEEGKRLRAEAAECAGVRDA